MTPAGGKDYHRRIEAAWARLKGRPGLLSPREFAIVEAWRQRGIPDALVLEVLDERRRRGAAPRSLTYVARAVEDSWSAIASGRAGSAEAQEAVGPVDETAWSRALERPDLSPACRAFLARLIGSFRQGADAGAVDDELDAKLPALAPPALVEAAERETDAALAPFRTRMPAEELTRTRVRARADRLRAALGLPRLL